jgi:hypothetical protein
MSKCQFIEPVDYYVRYSPLTSTCHLEKHQTTKYYRYQFGKYCWECDDCIIDVKGTHLAFGSNAKNVLVRGITFQSATSSSVTFYHDGAFEDCTWINNLGAQSNLGSVADLNSTSIVNFYRCEIGFQKKSWWWKWWWGPMVATKSTSSLSIRSN